MPPLKIHVIGTEENVLIFGFLGIEGTIVNEPENFSKEFNALNKLPSIGMIIIALDLTEEQVDNLVNFKLNKRKPFVYYLPNIFSPHIETEDEISKRISNIIGKLIV